MDGVEILFCVMRYRRAGEFIIFCHENIFALNSMQAFVFFLNDISVVTDFFMVLIIMWYHNLLPEFIVTGDLLINEYTENSLNEH